MKQFLTLPLLLCSYILCGAQATMLTVDNQTPGWLSSKIAYSDQQTVENLVVTGYVNQTDLSFIGTLMEKHSLNGCLDLTDAVVVDTQYAETSSSTIDEMFELSQWVKLKRLSLPLSLPRISPYLLARVEADTLVYGSSRCNTLTPFLTDNAYYTSNASPKVLILRDGVSKIDKFYQSNGRTKENLLAVLLPQTIDSIGDNAFKGVSNLSYINLPNSIHTIGKSAFAETSIIPDTLCLPTSLKVYNTSSFPIINNQVIILGNDVERFDNQDWTLTKNTTATYIINRVVPPTFNKGAKYDWYQPSYSDGKELSGCTLYVPKNGYSMYADPEYNSVGPGGTWSGWSNPYSHAKVKTIYIPVINISLNHSLCNLNVGNSINLTADVRPNDADNKDIVWKSNNPSVASVDNDGLVSALSCGNAIITASSKENASINATCEIAVHQPLQSIFLTPTNIRLKAGEMYEGLSISYNPATADNKHVTWQSSNPSIATVDSNGKITAIAGGEVIITVTSEENQAIKAECIISVIQPVTGISINKSAIELIEDESEQLIATITPDNASDKKINWTSSDVSIAMVSPDGTVYAIKQGQATIMATTVDGDFVALCKVTVKAKVIMATAIRLSHDFETIAIGEKLQLSAVLEPENITNSNVSWTSTNPNVATVNSTGLIQALSQGVTQIIATTTDGSNLSAICEIVVEKQFIEITQIQISPSSARMPVGKSIKLNAIITPSDATSTNVLWSSTNTSVATVSQDGNVEAIAEGEAIIIASTQDGSNLSATCNISVYNDIILISEIILDPVNIEGNENESATINAVIIPENATNKQLRWYSSNDDVAVVNDGVVKLEKKGIAIITAEALDGSNVKSECTVVVSESSGIESIMEDKNTVVKIFNLSGHLIYQGIYAEANIEHGIYIVVCNGKSIKAIIE